jgi:hypothetical protein
MEDTMYPYQPPWMQQRSIVDEIKALDEYKKSLLALAEEEKKKKPEPRKKEKSSLGFFEGLVIAYIAQVLYGPLTKLLMFYLQAHGVQ